MAKCISGATKLNLFLSAKAKGEIYIFLRFPETVKCGLVFKQERPTDTH